MNGRRPVSGRWLAYAIPGALLFVVVFQVLNGDKVDIGVLGLLCLFGFGALGWTIDDVVGRRVGNALRENVRTALEEGSQSPPADAPRPRDHDRADDPPA